MNLQQIDKQLEELNKKKQELENQKEVLIKRNQTKDLEYQKVIYKKRKYRIYKWDKPFKDFKVPEGFEWCPAIDLINMINDKAFEFEDYPVSYYAIKLFKDSYWELFWACLSWDSRWCAGGGSLAVSYGGGRVVLRKK
jgi:hypothetical protein